MVDLFFDKHSQKLISEWLLSKDKESDYIDFNIFRADSISLNVHMDEYTYYTVCIGRVGKEVSFANLPYIAEFSHFLKRLERNNKINNILS